MTSCTSHNHRSHPEALHHHVGVGNIFVFNHHNGQPIVAMFVLNVACPQLCHERHRCHLSPALFYKQKKKSTHYSIEHSPNGHKECKKREVWIHENIYPISTEKIHHTASNGGDEDTGHVEVHPCKVVSHCFT